MWAFEEFAPSSDHECEFVPTVWLYLAKMANEFKDVAPMQIPRQFSMKQTLMGQRELVMQVVFAHIAVSPPWKWMHSSTLLTLGISC